MMEFPWVLTQLRERTNTKQKTLAKVLGVTPSVVSQYEKGKALPGYDVMEKIADYFDVSVDYLLGREKTALQTERWLDEAYCGKLSRRQLLELCEALPAEKRRLLHGFLYLLGQEETKV